MTTETTTVESGTDEVLAVITAMVAEILDEYGLDEVGVTRQSTFHGDLGLESIDLVTLAGQLQERYGERVNLAEFLADKELSDVIGLTIGELVDFVAGRLGATAEGH
jgi:acyl carrier protein